MKLYGFLASPYVGRVVMAARAKGVDLPLEPPPGGSVKSPEYLRINPIGKMPTLEDAGHYIAESHVIVEYLDEAQPGQKLLPDDAVGRARARLLGRIMDLYVAPQASGLFRNMNPAQRSQAEVDAALTGLRQALGHLEHFMGPGPHALGERLTIADCSLFPTSLILTIILPGFGVADPFVGLPKLSAWWQHLNADALGARFAADYREAVAAFMKSRG